MEFKTVRTQETSASETNTTLKKKLGAVIAAAAVGLTGAACESNTGAVRHYSAEAGSSEGASNVLSSDSNSGEVLYGAECAEHEDKVAVSYPLDEGAPLIEGSPYQTTMDAIDRVFYREDEGLMGFGNEYVEFTPKQVADIQAGTLAIQRDYEEYYGEPIPLEELGMLQINVLNKDHEFRLKDGHVDGDMCVDAEDGNRALKK